MKLENIFLSTEINEDTAVLDEQESFHCVKVLRLSKGQELYCVDGKGSFYKGVLQEADSHRSIIKILETNKEYGKREYHLHACVAPTKNIDRFEWFLEKSTEIGIDEITPIICQHSERREIKTERLTKVLVASMKQSLKAYLPRLNNATSFTTAISEFTAEQKFICSGAASTVLKDKYELGKNVIVFVGPEGDFSKQEMQQAKSANFIEVNLGKSRLRTETAGVMATALINILNQ